MIYMDYNATTPLLPEVRAAMEPFWGERWGNPSSAYRFGVDLKPTIEDAREAVADLIGALPEELLFTSCATESNNAAISAALRARRGKNHIVTSLVEHSAVLNYCRMLETDGYRVTYLPVDVEGLLDPSTLKAAITPDTALVSLMWANNETGVLFPVEEIGHICREHNVLFHCDAAQAVGKVSVNTQDVLADYLTVSAHKIHGPKGIGALYIRHGTPFTPLLVGGHQEAGRRAGTENVALIAGFGKAAESALAELPDRTVRVKTLRDALESEILTTIPGCWINGSRTARLPNTTNVGFPGIDADAMVAFLDSRGICASSGSACLSQAISPSHVVFAMTGSREKATQSVRFSLSHLSDAAALKNLHAALVQADSLKTATSATM